jgi:excisionase family DNA binding protein
MSAPARQTKRCPPAKRRRGTCQPGRGPAPHAESLRSHETPAPSRAPHARPASRLTATDVMTGREVAALLHAPVSTVEDWARRDILPSVKIGRRRLYVRQSIEAVLTGHAPPR